MNRLLEIQNDLTESPNPKWMPISKTSSLQRYSQPKAAPALFGIAGLTTVEAINLGLGGVSLLQGVVTKSGSLSISSDKAERLLTPKARLKLNKRKKKVYTRYLMWINSFKAADALIEIT